MSKSILDRLDAIEREVWGNVCRCCNRPIEGALTVSDKDAEGWPRCSECAGAHRLDAWGCYVWLEEGTLCCSEIGEFQRHGKSAEFGCEVTAPESQDFLDAVNRQFGTTFLFDQFAGR